MVAQISRHGLIRGSQSESKHWDDPGSQPWPRLGRE